MYVEKSILIDLGPNCWGKEKRNWAKIDIIDTVSEKVLNSIQLIEKFNSKQLF